MLLNIFKLIIPEGITLHNEFYSIYSLNKEVQKGPGCAMGEVLLRPMIRWAVIKAASNFRIVKWGKR
jgi:hypothetical protein